MPSERQSVATRSRLLAFGHVLDAGAALVGRQHAGHRLNPSFRESLAQPVGHVVRRRDEAAEDDRVCARRR